MALIMRLSIYLVSVFLWLFQVKGFVEIISHVWQMQEMALFLQESTGSLTGKKATGYLKNALNLKTQPINTQLVQVPCMRSLKARGWVEVQASG